MISSVRQEVVWKQTRSPEGGLAPANVECTEPAGVNHLASGLSVCFWTAHSFQTEHDFLNERKASITW